MRRLLMPILFLFLVLWLFGGAWWYAQKQEVSPKQLVSEKTSLPPIFSIKADTLYIEVHENISFFQSSYDAYIPDAVNTALYQLAEYLNQVPDKVVLLTGYYISGESNNSNFNNLGVARAEAVKSRLIRLGLEGPRIITYGKMKPEMRFNEGVVYGAVSLKVDTPESFTKQL